jgi:hypothetical protein
MPTIAPTGIPPAFFPFPFCAPAVDVGPALLVAVSSAIVAAGVDDIALARQELSDEGPTVLTLDVPPTRPEASMMDMTKDVPDWTLGVHAKELEGDIGGVMVSDWPPGMTA